MTDNIEPLVFSAHELNVFELLGEAPIFDGIAKKPLESQLLNLLLVNRSIEVRFLNFGSTICCVPFELSEEFAEALWPEVLAGLDLIPNHLVLLMQICQPNFEQFAFDSCFTVVIHLLEFHL